MPVLTALLNLVPFGVVVVNTRGRILLVNPASEKILAEGTGFQVRDGKLAAVSVAHERALTGAVAQACRNRQPSAFGMVRPGQAPLSVAIAPLTNGSRVRKVLILLSDPKHNIAAQPEILAAMFDFSPAEAAVAQQMLEGRDVNEIAQNLELSAHTVRNHLKRLFFKTNTNGQCELLFTLMRSPAALRLQIFTRSPE